jgi:putative photosynthetic complex assembly protein 2
MLFLLGFVTGPRRTVCPAGLTGVTRFRAAAATVMHHELAIAATALGLAVLSLGAANTVALSTFVLLWGMRLASKAVVFTGAPNLAHGFLPAHLSYLKGYFGTGRPGLTFALVLGAVLGVAVILGVQAAALAPGSFAATAMWLMTTLAALAVFEHLALVLPLPDAALWSWAVRHPPIQTTKEGTP